MRIDCIYDVQRRTRCAFVRCTICVPTVHGKLNKVTMVQDREMSWGRLIQTPSSSRMQASESSYFRTCCTTDTVLAPPCAGLEHSKRQLVCTQQSDVYHELYLRCESARDIPDRSRQLWKQQSQPSFLSQSDPTQSFGYMSAIWDQHPTTRLEAARHVSGLLRARPCTAACQ